MQIISNFGITYETANNIKISHLNNSSIIKKFNVSSELIKLIKRGNYKKSLLEMKNNYTNGQLSFKF